MASEMPADDLVPLFRLCLRISPDPQRIANDVITDDPVVLRQFVEFLVSSGDPESAVPIAQRLLDRGSLADRVSVINLIDALIALGSASSGLPWTALQKKRWIEPDSDTPYNGDFHRAVSDEGPAIGLIPDRAHLSDQINDGRQGRRSGREGESAAHWGNVLKWHAQLTLPDWPYVKEGTRSRRGSLSMMAPSAVLSSLR